MARQRLDRALVERGLVGSRQEAVAAIEAHRVLVGGSLAEKPARQVAAGDAIVLTGQGPRYVSRGGAKLARALEAFELSPEGRLCLDAGSSTGGFTDCLLQNGARRVVSVDVGYGQLHERLRQDPRVVVLERTNVRELNPHSLAALILSEERPSLITADLSFTSLRPVVPVLLELLDVPGELLLLCKPQFEVGREVASRGSGVVRDRQDRRSAVLELVATLEASGAAIMGVVSSPILGPAGNAEFLLHARSSGHSAPGLGAALEDALDQAEAL